MVAVELKTEHIGEELFCGGDVFGVLEGETETGADHRGCISPLFQIHPRYARRATALCREFLACLHQRRLGQLERQVRQQTVEVAFGDVLVGELRAGDAIQPKRTRRLAQSTIRRQVPTAMGAEQPPSSTSRTVSRPWKSR